ncbi:MAG TPA: helix-turn-helix transcriptional regulator [Thermoanaerobacterales bacterium]|nr:helix-turn-helix transcriptional regulator [Thermoanaerobacterales bacterium]
MKWKEYRKHLINKENISELQTNELHYNLLRELIKCRHERNLTQKELAEIIGTKQSAISRLESGKLNPSVKFLQKVANALNVKIDIKIIPEE